MNSKSSHTSGKRTLTKRSTYIGAVLYVLALAVFSLLLFIEPEGLNIRIATVTLVVTLFVVGLAPAYHIAAKNQNRIVAILGTISLATLFALIGLFIAAGAAWLIALSHV